jgi:hypothetical protein
MTRTLVILLTTIAFLVLATVLVTVAEKRGKVPPEVLRLWPLAGLLTIVFVIPVAANAGIETVLAWSAFAGSISVVVFLAHRRLWPW